MTNPDSSVTPTLVEGVEACFREHRLLRAALVNLMNETRGFLEPVGSYANPAMHQARCALDGQEPRP